MLSVLLGRHVGRGDGPPGRRGRDAGVTLPEVLISMGVFLVVLLISLSATRSLVGSTVRVTSAVDGRTQADRLHDRLDKLVPYAVAVNPAGMSGGGWWVEFRTDVAAGGQPAGCWQLNLDPSGGTVRLRRWDSGQAVPGAWAPLVVGARERSGAAPFQMLPADDSVVRQRLVLALDVAAPGDVTTSFPVDATFVARNSGGIDTVTEPVCQEVPRA